MSQTKHQPDTPYLATDLSQDGLCVLCWNLIARSLALHLDANYEANPYKDIPFTAKHPIIADVSEDLYLNVLQTITEGATDPTHPVNLAEFLRVIVGSCTEMIAHPEMRWFEPADEDSDEDSEEDEEI